MLEVCAGSHRMATASAEMGLKAHAVDAKNSEELSLVSDIGPGNIFSPYGSHHFYWASALLQLGKEALPWSSRTPDCLHVSFRVLCQSVLKKFFFSQAWLGPPCASWVWVSRGSTHRSRLHPKGNRRRFPKVRASNRLCRRLALLCLGYCWS